MKLNFYFILLISIFIFSACSSSTECETNSDCRNLPCSTVSCNDGYCDYDYIDNCCGNGICEDGQNSCNCPEDCGQCNLPAGMNQNYFEVFCDENHQCSNDVKEGLHLRDSIVLNNQDIGRDYKVNIRINYNKPFNVKKDLFDIEIELAHSTDNVDNLKITKIQLVSADRNPIIYADKEINKMLWQIDSKINEEIYITRSIPEFETQLLFNIILHYEYDLITRGTNKITHYTTFNMGMSDPLKILNPEREYYCYESDCYTNNPGLEGRCIEGKPFCEYTIIPNQCGNFICETGQNKCNCPHDCGPCTGPIGDYLEYSCDEENNCVSFLSSNQITNSYINEISRSYFTLSAYTDVKEPHIMGEDTINLKFELIRFSDSFEGPIVFTKIDVIASDRSNKLLGTLYPNQDNSLSNRYDTVSFSIPITADFDGYFDSKNIQFQVNHNYRYNTIERNRIDGEMIETVVTKTNFESFSNSISNFNMVKVGE